jgi:hypothetical protein
LLLGTTMLGLGALLGVVGTSFFNRDAFADRTAAALHHAGVRAFLADRVTDAVIGQKPDLVAVRPFVLTAATGLVGTRPFEAIVRKAAGRAHQVVFSEGAERLVVALPDVGLLVRSVLERANPALAEKLPPQLQQTLASAGEGKSSEVILDLLRLGARLRLQAVLFLAVGLLLLGFSVWLEPDRRRGFGRVGIGVATAGVVLLCILPLVRLLLALLVEDPLTSGAAVGFAVSYLGNLRGWGLVYLGIGMITSAGGAAFFERVESLALLRRAAAWLITPPVRFSRRVLWSLLVLVLGVTIVLEPSAVAAGLVALGGVLLAYLGLRELFRMLGDWVMSVPAVEAAARGHARWPVRVVVVGALPVAAVVAWMLVRNPLAPPVVPSSITVCNGSAALCDRRLDEVTFAGAHNAMSNQDIADWMFPHHQAGILRQLRDGVRAFAIDIHYGFPGGARVKTDFGEGGTRVKLAGAVGEEGTLIAERIRNTLVGADEGRRGLYFCHGFCELGAYEPLPVLRQVRDFLVEHPDEVLIVIIEDYVPPAELARLFDEAELAEFVFRGPAAAAWPTLRALITLGQRVVVFTETGSPGVPWLLPTLRSVQETPYTFKSPEDFSCVPNRGGTEGSLFLVNHWIETTPAPRPSNAEMVNAEEVLLARARQCEKERGKRPNILMVDFYRSGDLMAVVDSLNAMGASNRP